MSPISRRGVAFVSWFLLGCAGAASMGAYRYPPWAVLALAAVWLLASVASVWAPPRQRTLSLVIVLATSVAMRRTFLQLLWATATVRGKI